MILCDGRGINRSVAINDASSPLNSEDFLLLLFSVKLRLPQSFLSLHPRFLLSVLDFQFTASNSFRPSSTSPNNEATFVSIDLSSLLPSLGWRTRQARRKTGIHKAEFRKASSTWSCTNESAVLAPHLSQSLFCSFPLATKYESNLSCCRFLKTLSI